MPQKFDDLMQSIRIRAAANRRRCEGIWGPGKIANCRALIQKWGLDLFCETESYRNGRGPQLVSCRSNDLLPSSPTPAEKTRHSRLLDELERQGLIQTQPGRQGNRRRWIVLPIETPTPRNSVR